MGETKANDATSLQIAKINYRPSLTFSANSGLLHKLNFQAAEPFYYSHFQCMLNRSNGKFYAKIGNRTAYFSVC